MSEKNAKKEDDLHQDSKAGAQKDAEPAAQQKRKKKTCAETPNHKKRWDEMYNRLLEFKKRHSHCRVPNRYDEDPQLGYWVSTQRRQYRMLMFGEGSGSTPLAPDRVAQLNQIGFDWTAQDPRKKPWETRFEELRNFVKQYGHSQVPIGWKENPRLATWVSTQRQEYRLRKQGRSSRLTDSKIEMLNDIGFIWEAQRGRQRTLHERRPTGHGASLQALATTPDTTKGSAHGLPFPSMGPNNEDNHINDRDVETSSNPQQASLTTASSSFPEDASQSLSSRNVVGNDASFKNRSLIRRLITQQQEDLHQPPPPTYSSSSLQPRTSTMTMRALFGLPQPGSEQSLFPGLGGLSPFLPSSAGNLRSLIGDGPSNLRRQLQLESQLSSSNVLQFEMQASRRLMMQYLATQQQISAPSLPNSIINTNLAARNDILTGALSDNVQIRTPVFTPPLLSSFARADEFLASNSSIAATNRGNHQVFLALNRERAIRPTYHSEVRPSLSSEGPLSQRAESKEPEGAKDTNEVESQIVAPRED